MHLGMIKKILTPSSNFIKSIQWIKGLDISEMKIIKMLHVRYYQLLPILSFNVAFSCYVYSYENSLESNAFRSNLIS